MDGIILYTDPKLEGNRYESSKFPLVERSYRTNTI